VNAPRLKALAARAVAWMRGPIRARDDHTNNESRRLSGLDLDEVMALTEDLRNLLAVITACADAMRRNAARRLST
jgi:hypothetical protein